MQKTTEQKIFEITEREARRTYIDRSKFLYITLHKIKVSTRFFKEKKMDIEQNETFME